MRKEHGEHIDTVREVLEERLKTLLKERIGPLLLRAAAGTTADDIISELAGELADEAVSALGIRQSELDEPWCDEEEETDGQIP